MSRDKDSFEKKELDGSSWWRKAFAYKFGKKGAEALKAGVWSIAEPSKGRPVGISWQRATGKLIVIMDEAARTHDGPKLRRRAYAIEARKYCNVHDPSRATLLPMKAPDPFFKGMVCSAMMAPKTAEAVQDLIRAGYPPKEVPTLKSIREPFRECF